MDGATIDRPNIMVNGTFANNTGVETGITVNGISAMVYGNQFVVNHLPLQEGQNIITITVTDVDGHIQQKSISIYAVMPEHYIEILPNIESGSAPFEADLTVRGSFAVENVSLGYSGAGSVEIIDLEDNAYRIQMAAEGIY